MIERPRGLKGLMTRKEVVGATVGGIIGILVLVITNNPSLACYLVGGGISAGAAFGGLLNFKPT